MHAMNRTTLIAAVFAVLIVATGFVAAAPGNAPVSVDADADSADDSQAEYANEHAADAENANERDANNANEAADNSAADERNGQGPNVDLPDQVPDHVSAIHERISSFLSGALESPLGDAVSEVTPDDESADDSDEAVDGDDGADEAVDGDDGADEADDASEADDDNDDSQATEDADDDGDESDNDE
ncbi:hypothetical protein C494_06535 [Natronorubrum bangense JCM 10635]|uniref:Uncharacterized protein n=2 Tax=Natronorubrum bangense TaxID=61858 RepID=L9WKX9_9EURY|nr:hypothetical protein C494_06535 [Natronorubrum bangense JCM 10635]